MTGHLLFDDEVVLGVVLEERGELIPYFFGWRVELVVTFDCATHGLHLTPFAHYLTL